MNGFQTIDIRQTDICNSRVAFAIENQLQFVQQYLNKHLIVLKDEKKHIFGHARGKKSPLNKHLKTMK